MDSDKCVGGIIVKINKETNRNALEILYINPNFHNKGYGQRAWKLIENIYSETNVWETCTPYFERRNIHFYVNKLKFHIVEYYNSKILILICLMIIKKVMNMTECLSLRK